MMTDRRRILLGLMFALGGSAAVASCDTGASDDEILRGLRPNGRLVFYNPREFQLVSLLADAIIPRTDTPGAIDANAPAYLDAMINAWASRQTKADHRRGLRDIRARLRELGGQEIQRLPDAERRAAIAAFDAEAYADQSANTAAVSLTSDGQPKTAGQHYRAIKTVIAQVYYATEPGATEELHYQAVPGSWVADAPLSQIGRSWAE